MIANVTHTLQIEFMKKKVIKLEPRCLLIFFWLHICVCGLLLCVVLSHKVSKASEKNEYIQT